jgi:hypothetical protein
LLDGIDSSDFVVAGRGSGGGGELNGGSEVIQAGNSICLGESYNICAGAICPADPSTQQGSMAVDNQSGGTIDVVISSGGQAAYQQIPNLGLSTPVPTSVGASTFSVMASGSWGVKLITMTLVQRVNDCLFQTISVARRGFG